MRKIPCGEPGFQNVEEFHHIFEQQTGITLPHCDRIELDDGKKTLYFVEETEVYDLNAEDVEAHTPKFQRLIQENVRKMWGSFCLFITLCRDGEILHSRRRIYALRTTIATKDSAILAEALKRELLPYKNGIFHDIYPDFPKEV